MANRGPPQLLQRSFDGRACDQLVTEPIRPTRPLFADVSITEVLALRRQLIATALAELPDDEILGRKLDELAAEQVDRYRMQLLTLEWGATTTQMRTVRRRAGAHEQLDAASHVAKPQAPYLEVCVLVPFAGTPGLFDFRPSVPSSETALGFVIQPDLRLSTVAADHDVAGALADLERQEVSIKELASAVNRDVDAFNAALPQEIGRALAARLAGLQADNKLSETLGIPRRRPSAPASDGQRRVGPARGADGRDPDQPRGRGRPEWTPGQFQTSWRKAVAATPEQRTYERLAPNFVALDGTLGVSADYLRRLRRRFRWLAE